MKKFFTLIILSLMLISSVFSQTVSSDPGILKEEGKNYYGSTPEGFVPPVPPEPPLEISITASPNPFITSTQIKFTASKDIDKLNIMVYNLIGQKVATLMNGPVSAGQEYKIIFNPEMPVNQGIYQVLFKSGSLKKTKSLIRIKQ